MLSIVRIAKCTQRNATQVFSTFKCIYCLLHLDLSEMVSAFNFITIIRLKTDFSFHNLDY